MSKRFKKLAAVVLASAMLLQNGASLLAEEAQTPPAETVVTEAPAEPQTPAPEETPTEPQTPAPTEAPTEPQTPAPTEAPTEPQTPAPTEAPAEPQTPAPTEAPTEPQTEAPVEETELSERENDGEEFAAASLVEKLQQALTYLFAAEKIDAAKGLLKGQEITDGAEGKAVADALKEISLQLANAKDSSEVQVLNLYADETGTLDTAQLDEQFEDQVIDVTKQYFVVNVIANSADQALTFSGYKMKLDGAPVEYAEGTEPGDVIYNFAALDDAGDYIDYTGELSLNNAEGLQGTFLAPAAKVTVGSDLAGAVFAQSVTVADSVKELMQISFVTGREPAEETETEELESEPETTAAETEESESETSGTTAAETEESESETSEITAAETEELPMPTYMEEGDGTETPVLEATVKVQFGGKDIYALYGTDGMYEEDTGLPYVSLFTKDNESYTRVTTVEPKKLTFAEGETGAELIYTKNELTGLTNETTYYLKLTDSTGKLPEGAGPTLSQTGGDLSFTYNGGNSLQTLDNIILGYDSGTSGGMLPTGFYYPVNLTLTKTCQGSDGTAKNFSDTFYASLYTDETHKTPLQPDMISSITKLPVALAMSGNTAVTATMTLKATRSPMTLYLAETDASGNPFNTTGIVGTGNDALHFSITLSGNGDTATASSAVPGTITASLDSPMATATITNTLNAPSVKVGVVNGNRRNLAGVKLVIKDDKGKILTVVNNAKSFASGGTDLYVNNLKPGTYYLSEVSAPSGYAPAKDVQFTVEDGKETVAHLTNVSASSTDYKLTVNKQVYCGEYQLYANPEADEGSRTYHVALFEGSDHLVKVSDVLPIMMSGLTGSVTFLNLKHNETYFLAETDELGDPHISGHGVSYESEGMVKMEAKTRTTVVRNNYTSVPKGFRYTATLTITKHVTSASGAAKAVEDEKFYVGIYRKADYSDTPTIVELPLSNKAAASKRQRITFGNNNNPSVTYYFAEVDSKGNRVDNTDTFGYNVSIDSPSMTIKRGEDKEVTVTNQEKSSKVTLYLTKRVYEGTALKPVTDTFYVGLFRDAKFSELYTNPIPMQLQNKSELTLKLSLNLGKADKVTIYLAETDQRGNVIRNESQFGYNIRAINSTAVFTQQRREIQAIFLNSVYGTSTDDDWKQILSDENNQPAYGGSDGWVGGNGEIDPNADTVAAQTGDETPIGLYIGLLAAAAVVLILLLILRMRKKKRE